MQLTVTNPKALAAGIGHVAKAAAKRSTLPVLQNVLIQAAASGKLRLVAMNLEYSLSTILDGIAKVREHGEITLPATMAQELLSTFGTEDLEWDLRPTMIVKLQSSRRKASIKGIDPAEFPLVYPMQKLREQWDAAGSEVFSASVRLPIFLDMIRRAAHAVARDSIKPVLTGIFIRFQDDGTLEMAGADGYRLSTVRSTGLDCPASWSVIVPVEALESFTKLVEKSDKGEVSLAYCPGREHIVFKVGELEMVSQVIEGNYPDFLRLIPKQAAASVTVSLQEAKEANKLANLFTNAANMVQWTFGEDALNFFANFEDGDVKTGFPIKGGNGERPPTANYNGKFSLQALSSFASPYGFGDEDVIIDWASQKAPLVLRQEGTEVMQALCLIMPMTPK